MSKNKVNPKNEKKSSKNEIYLNEKGRFKKGNPGGGRPKGVPNHKGIRAVYNMLEELITEKKNLNLLRTTLQRALEQHPLGFYYKYIMPLFPKNVDISGKNGEPIQLIITEKILPKGTNGHKSQ